MQSNNPYIVTVSDFDDDFEMSGRATDALKVFRDEAKQAMVNNARNAASATKGAVVRAGNATYDTAKGAAIKAGDAANRVGNATADAAVRAGNATADAVKRAGDATQDAMHNALERGANRMKRGDKDDYQNSQHLQVEGLQPYFYNPYLVD